MARVLRKSKIIWHTREDLVPEPETPVLLIVAEGYAEGKAWPALRVGWWDGEAFIVPEEDEDVGPSITHWASIYEDDLLPEDVDDAVQAVTPLRNCICSDCARKNARK
jgi:hypothetical protein